MSRAVIFSNGDVRSLTAVNLLLQKDDFLVAVDGGSRHLADLDRIPGLLIGDLDSISPALRETYQSLNIPVMSYPSKKDWTDLELALDEVCRRGYVDLLVIGGWGSRLDHSIANISLLYRPDLISRRVRMTDGVQEAFVIRGSAVIEGNPGDTVSLLPFGADAKGIQATGFEFPLRNETLPLYRARGISNRLADAKAGVQLAEGNLLCIHQKAEVK